MIQLALATIPPIILAEPTISGATLAQLGDGGESPSVDVALDPGRGEVANLLDPPPLRCRAVLDYGNGETFEGIVQAVRLGSTSSITLEA